MTQLIVHSSLCVFMRESLVFDLMTLFSIRNSLIKHQLRGVSYPKICPTFFYFYLAYIKIICIHGPQFIQLGHAFNIPFIPFCITHSVGQSFVRVDVIGLSGFLRHILFGNYPCLFRISLVVCNISLFEIHDCQRE